MKRILFSIIATVAAFASCSKFDDTQIWDKLNDHEERIVALETLCGQMNTNIASLQAIIQALQENDYITNVVAIMENGVEVGYQITFSKGKTITIYHGKDGKDGVNGTDGKNGHDGAPGADGKDGVDGTDGKDGQDGKDGKDGQAPVIGVKQDTDGVYYWTLNGEWLLDDNGNKIPTTGKDGDDGKDGQNGTDGKDGQDGAPGADGEDGKDGADGTDGKDGVNGTDGKDGITPQLKIEEDYWYISYDNGTTWTQLGRATGEDGKDGADGQDGAPGADGKDGVDGTDGKDGDTMFASVDVTNPDYIIFTLADGTQFKIPTWKAFEELKAMVDQMNKNIEALQTIVAALQNNDYVTGVSPIYDGVREIGYTINFSKSGKVTIYHGEDGTDGKDGQDGAPGADGKDGVDGQTPVIGVKQDTDGVYYWTLNGEWLLDDNGNKIPTTGKDGADGKDGQDGADGNDGQDGVDGAPGANGADGKDGVTPQLKIENDYWYISYDNGTTWAQLGKATGEDGQDGAQGPQGSAGKDGDSFFKEVNVSDPNQVVLTLVDGTQIKIPTTRIASNYWYGKKMVMNGDSIPYGSGLSNKSDAFPYLVAESLGMNVINYSIGGTTISKRSGDYDECYVDLDKWKEDKANGYLDPSKKYLVNIENGQDRNYRIYSYNSSDWVAGGSSSNQTGRTPLSDRTAAMDKDADVVMVMGGSNDFYYNWAPFGNFDDGTYRRIGYTDGGIEDGPMKIDTSVNLLSSDGVELVEPGAPTSAGSTVDASYTAYFTYRNIPIKGGRAVKVPYGRRGWWINAYGEDISTINFTSGTNDYTAIAPKDAVSLTICFKYEEKDPADCAVYMSTDEEVSREGIASTEPNETFYDGLHKLCRYLRHTYPKADIIFLTPIKRVQQDVWDCVYPEDKNAYGKTLNDYREAIIKCCEYYSINCIDLYTISGLNPHIDTSLFADTNKAVHPNEEGHRILADIIISQMQNMHR